MASDPLAFFKWKRLGDFLEVLPSLTPQVDAPEPRSVLGGNTADIHDRGGNARFEIEVKHALARTSSETYRDFYLRRVSYCSDLATVAGRASTYSSAGDLVIVEDSSTDETTLNSGASSGTDIDLDLTADISIAVGDYVLITDESAAYEVVVAKSGTTGTTLTCDPTLTWSSGATVVRALYTVPSARITELPTIESSADTGSTQFSYDLSLRFLATSFNTAS